MRHVSALVVCAAVAASCSLTTSLSGLTGGPDDPGTGPDADSSTPDATADAPQLSPLGWQFRKALTIAPASVAGDTDLVDFPVLVSTTDADLKTVANGGKVVRGVDIAFLAADGVTPLAHEIEQYSATTGRLLAWVKLPVLSPATGGRLYVMFGNPDVTTSVEDRRAVWSAAYAGVWHMNDSQWTDSAASSNGMPIGGASTAETGMIGGGGLFGATDVYVDVGGDPNLQPTSITVSAWAKPASVGSAPNRHPYMVRQDSWRADGSDPRGYYMEIYRTQTDPRPTFYTANGTAKAHAFATTNVVNGTWYHVVGTRDEVSGVTRIYVDGVQEGSATMTGGIAYLPNTLRLGGIGAETWDGMLDEVRVSRVARSAGWIHTEYDNQRSPQTFVSVGALEAVPPQ